MIRLQQSMRHNLKAVASVQSRAALTLLDHMRRSVASS